LYQKIWQPRQKACVEASINCRTEKLIFLKGAHTGGATESVTGLPDFSWNNIPKRGKILPKDYKIYQLAAKHTKWL
jgi:hypothetical protein